MDIKYEKILNTEHDNVFLSLLVAVEKNHLFLSVISQDPFGDQQQSGGIMNLNELDQLIRTLIEAREAVVK